MSLSVTKISPLASVTGPTCTLHFHLLGPFCGAIAVASVTRCRRRCRCCFRCHCRGRRCAGGVRQWRRATVATPGEWKCKIRTVRRLTVANGPNIFQMLLVSYVSEKRLQQILKPVQKFTASQMYKLSLFESYYKKVVSFTC